MGTGTQFEGACKPQCVQNGKGLRLRDAERGGRKFKGQKWGESEGEKEGRERRRVPESRVVLHHEMWKLVVWRNMLLAILSQGFPKKE